MMAGVFANGTTDGQTDAAGGIAALIKGRWPRPPTRRQVS